MNCQDMNERLAEYWDLPEDSELRAEIDRHVAGCASCREEFELWQSSAELIQSVRWSEEPPAQASEHPIAGQVMQRIYASENWRLPLAFRHYTFSWRVRRNIMACIAMCLTIFIVSFMYSLVTGGAEEAGGSGFAGILETAHAKGGSDSSHPAMFDNIPVASISAPSILKVGPIETYPDYLLITSIVGFICMLLLMNWLSRLRA
jgi:hypothetical protein